jgi:putative ABC transport system permease protein
MYALLRDIRFASRMLLKNPAVTAVALFVLALGTGANSAIFSVVHAVLLRPLPVRDADRLVTVAMASEKLRVAGAQPSLALYEKWRRETQSSDYLAAAAPGTATFSSEGDTTVKFWRVSASFLPTLGVEPVLGRNFLADEDQPGKAHVAVLGSGFWRGRMNGDRKAIGSVIKVDGEPYTVIGVLPAGFHIDGRPADIYAPIGRRAQGREGFPVNVYARLRPGVTIGQAQAELDALTKRADRGPFDWRPRLWGLRDFQVRNLRLSLWVLLGAVGLVLLIACANTATLLLARAGARRKEIATRAALGADRRRLLRQLLTESALLSLAGAACGVLAARAAVRLVPLLAHERLPGLLEQTRVDGVVLAFTIAISLLTGFLFGAAPAVAALRGNLFGALQEGGRSGAAGRRRGWNSLVVSETALALVLAIGAGLLIRTFFYLRDVAPGFRVDGLLTVRVTPPRSKFTSPAQCNAYWKDIVERLRGIPGAQSASFAQALPLTGDNWVGTWPVEGVAFSRPQDIPPMWQYFVEAEYFRTMQIPLRRGRFFGARDDAGAPKVAIVNEGFVRRFWPGQEAIGKHIGGGEDPRMEIIGVVADVSAEESTKSAPPEIYFHFLQMPTARIAAVVRVDPRVFASPTGIEQAARRAIELADPAKPPLQFAEMRRMVSDRIAPHRLSAQLIGIFAGLALALAAAGIYGVLSFSVAERTHEIGLRMALGAERGRVLGLIVGEAALLAGGGIGIGLAGALALTRLMRSLLFGVEASDPLIYAGSAAALMAIALFAAAVPAWRATRIDPMACLRHE